MENELQGASFRNIVKRVVIDESLVEVAAARDFFTAGKEEGFFFHCTVSQYTYEELLYSFRLTP